jgi:hypothetical protein
MKKKRKHSLWTKFKIFLCRMEIYKKCPICGKKIYESYNYVRCSDDKCSFGNKFRGCLKNGKV